ncbi:MAG TPA: lipopolysaccharide biosynthesis protein [Caulobacteraceae bacterium]|nr:lipopolysaccharide biosynthesis protein [Caulobacteraceae bacterium]
MIAPSAWTERPSAPAFASDAVGARGQLSAKAVLSGLWRERTLMAVVFATVLAIGAAFGFTLKTAYPAHASLLIRLGQEYVYEPRIGDAGRGAVPSTDQVIQSEVEILGSEGLHQKVVEALGVGRIEPGAARRFDAAGPEERAAMTAQATADLGQALKVESAPDDSIIRLTYSARDPDTAAAVLSQLVQSYLSYRKQVLIDGAEPATADQRAILEQRLAAADNALQTFMADNQIGDFDAEKTALSTLRASLVDENFRVQARLSEIGGREGEINHQAATVAPVISLYKDTNATPSDKLLQLKLDRQDLLSRYKPDSQPVKDADRKIADLQAMIASGQAESAGPRRDGPNPLYQAVETEKLQLAAEGASLRQRAAALARQVQDVNQQQMRLLALEPRYQELLRDRDVLSDNVKSLASKAEEDQAAQAIAQKSNDNIRVVEPAVADLRGKSLRKPVLILSVLFAVFAAVCAGLLGVFMRTGTINPITVARDLDLPILATAELKPRTR